MVTNPTLIEAILMDKHRLEQENAELWAIVKQQTEIILRLHEALERAHQRNGHKPEHDDEKPPETPHDAKRPLPHPR